MEHSCFILTQQERENRKKKNNKNNKLKGYIFFDYECMNNNGVHEPNLVVVDKVCVECLNEWKTLKYNEKSKSCKEPDCGVQNFKTNENFCKWLLKQDFFICIAHNLRAYDSVFIIVNVPFVPSFLQPIIRKYIKILLMSLVSSTIDATVTIFKNTGVFKLS
jgi:hypothetical protein